MTAPPRRPATEADGRTDRGRRRVGTRTLLVGLVVAAVVVTAATVWLADEEFALDTPASEDPVDESPRPSTEDDEPGPDQGDQPDAQADRPDVTSGWTAAWESDDLEALRAWFEQETGPSDEQALEPVEGPITSQRDGEIIENLSIQWSTEGQPRPNSQAAIRVDHDDVTIRNVRIRAEGPSRGIEFGSGTSGGRVEHCEIDGAASSYGTGRADANYGNDGIIAQGGPVDVRFCHIHAVRVGLQAIPGAEVAHNWIHSLHQNAPETSTSSIQRHPESTVDEPSIIQANLVEAGSSGGITMYAENDAVRDSQVTHNLVVGVGRGFGIRGGRSHVEAGHYVDNRDIRIEGNRFTGEFGFPDALGEGTNAGVDLERPGNTFVDNRWLGDDRDLAPRCGVTRDDCEG
jgi:hypothetical protein